MLVRQRRKVIPSASSYLSVLNNVTLSGNIYAAGIPLPSQAPLDSLQIEVYGNYSTLGDNVGGLGDGLLRILKRATVNRANKNNPIPVDMSGISLLHYGQQILPSLDAATNKEIILAPKHGAIARAAGGTFRITYPIMFGHRQTVDPLYSATLLPVHLDARPATLDLVFSSIDEMGLNCTTNDGAITALYCRVTAKNRDMPASIEKFLTDKYGDGKNPESAYLLQELKEACFPVTATVTDFKAFLPRPRQITGVCLRTYGGAKVTANGATMDYGDSTTDPTTSGWWTLYNGDSNPIEEFYLNDLLTEQEQAGLPAGDYLASKITIPPPKLQGSYMLNFLTPYGTDAVELGSLLNTDLGNNVDSWLQAACTTGTGAQINVITHSFLDKAQVNRWRALQF